GDLRHAGELLSRTASGPRRCRAGRHYGTNYRDITPRSGGRCGGGGSYPAAESRRDRCTAPLVAEPRRKVCGRCAFLYGEGMMVRVTRFAVGVTLSVLLGLPSAYAEPASERSSAFTQDISLRTRYELT